MARRWVLPEWADGGLALAISGATGRVESSGSSKSSIILQAYGASGRAVRLADVVRWGVVGYQTR